MKQSQKKVLKQKMDEFDVDSCPALNQLRAAPKQRTLSIGSVDSNCDPSELPPPPLREFEDLKSFEMFLRDETEDNDFDYCHAHVTYYPPFVMKQCHDNLEKIKPTMNAKNSKFKRDLVHHIQKHLLVDLERSCGYKFDMGKPQVSQSDDVMQWMYHDMSHHGFLEEEEDKYNRHWRTDLKVSCKGDSPVVDVDYMAFPI